MGQVSLWSLRGFGLGSRVFTGSLLGSLPGLCSLPGWKVRFVLMDSVGPMIARVNKRPDDGVNERRLENRASSPKNRNDAAQWVKTV